MGGRGRCIAVALALLCAATACSDLQAVDRRHQRLCREQAGVVVHDAVLWRRYREGARAAYLARNRESGEKSGELALEHVEGFEERFGPELRRMRPGTNGKLERNDIVILHRGVRVATAVDIIGSYPAFGHTAVFTCMKYPELYRRAAPRAPS